MLNKKIVLGAMGAAVIVASSAVALATEDVPFQIVTGANNSSIQIGSKLPIPVGAGTLVTSIGAQADGVCPLTISAAKSNSTFQQVDVVPGLAKAKLQICDDIVGQVTDTSDGNVGTITADARIKVLITTPLGNCEIPCTPVTFHSSLTGGSDYDPMTGATTLVTGIFHASPAVGGAICANVNSVLGLNANPPPPVTATLSLQGPADGPKCVPAPPPPATDAGDDGSDSSTDPSPAPAFGR
jgi:hypothetical protein